MSSDRTGRSRQRKPLFPEPTEATPLETPGKGIGGIFHRRKGLSVNSPRKGKPRPISRGRALSALALESGSRSDEINSHKDDQAKRDSGFTDLWAEDVSPTKKILDIVDKYRRLSELDCTLPRKELEPGEIKFSGPLPPLSQLKG
jgi:hypothetical protein